LQQLREIGVVSILCGANDGERSGSGRRHPHDLMEVLSFINRKIARRAEYFDSGAEAGVSPLGRSRHIHMNDFSLAGAVWAHFPDVVPVRPIAIAI
jgi:galactose-1-phosphate uridylyltransferase